MIVPNALAASASVVVTCITARRWTGPLTGLTAGAVVATTPILVAVARSNQPETFFVLALALTAWAATRALDRRSLGWLLLAGVFIAAGFHTYMLEAWAVWPALALAYLCTPQSRARRIWHLAVAGATSLALSLVWIVAVALVPASARPYIGSTLSNNPWEMVFGYNGLGRFGQVTADETAYRSFTPPFSGSPAALRLLNDALATQIGWMLPTALVAVAVLFVLRFRLPLTVFGTAWFVTFAAMFSAVAGMHQFYTAALAIPTALLIGTAFALARRRGVLWAQLALPATAAVTALCISIATPAATYSLVAAALQCAVAAVTAGLVLTERRRGRRIPVTAVAGVIALLLTPMVWAVVTMGTPNSTNPVAGGVAAQGVPGASGSFGAGRAPAAAPAAARERSDRRRLPGGTVARPAAPEPAASDAGAGCRCSAPPARRSSPGSRRTETARPTSRPRSARSLPRASSSPRTVSPCCRSAASTGRIRCRPSPPSSSSSPTATCATSSPAAPAPWVVVGVLVVSAAGATPAPRVRRSARGCGRTAPR